MDRIKFKINGQEYSGGGEISSDTTLLDYLRNQLELRGTKYMCREGGCGACIVTASPGPGATPRAVNSCLVSITSCQDWDIITIEKVGNRLEGYHQIQKTLAEENGTQCGYCTPGWVMALHSLLQSNKNLTMIEIEKSFASNICRCTGYRPILQAFKKFALDAPDNLLMDIEDLKICGKTSKFCNKKCNNDDQDWCFIEENCLSQANIIYLELKDGRKWYKVTEIVDIFKILNEKVDESSMLVAGNTAKGAFPIDAYPHILIDISGISREETDFGYLQKFYDHIQLVAHIPVRNLATIAGNLMTKHKHRKFASDTFLLFETVGAYLTILDVDGSKSRVTMEGFLNTNMNRKVILNILLPPLNNEYSLVTFKIMPRSQNAHAIVNTGFLYKLSNNIVLDSRLVFGGLSPAFTRATETEKYLDGKPLFENSTLQGALKILDKEILVEEDSPQPSSEYRKQLALALFYKGLLTLCPDQELDRRYRSGVKRIHESRTVSQGSQEFSTNPIIYPLNQPITKVDALIQCAGEATFTDDLPSFPHELFAVFVLSTVGRGTIESIDTREAMRQPGVVAFYSAKDIPGKNSFIMHGLIVFTEDEEVFCSKQVKYYNQPLGIVVAESTTIAERAAKLVKVTYSNVTIPILDIKDVKSDSTRTKLFLPIPALGRGLFVDKTFKNTYTIYGQYHFSMETIMCVTSPSEEGLVVYSTSQWIDAVQYTVAKALKLDENRVDVHVKRLGGAFGIKITRGALAAVACSLASYKLNRPCRLIQSMPNTTRSLGKRLPCSTDVEVGVDKKGLIQYLNYDLYSDNGYIPSEIVCVLGIDVHNNCYKRLWWNYKCFNSTTDNAKNTWCRAPSSLENIAMAETIMEQISYETSSDPYEVRKTNVDFLLYNDILQLGEKLKTKAQYFERRTAVNKFNAENRWKKRGLRWSFMRYTPLSPAGYEVNMSVCHGDGSVIISHGGIELGQGINTKAIQIAAYFLKIPIEKIQVKSTNTITGTNSILTGSSLTSQSIGMGVEKCCKQLLLRLAPIKVLLINPPWETLIKIAHTLSIDLQVHSYVNNIISPVYYVYGVALAEVEVDILTGESEVLRVDLIEDVGRSVSPKIDVGQIEGAFIMGLGYWTSEKLVYDKKSGELLTDRSWNYYVPQARDIPRDFRIYFREKSYSSKTVLGAKVTGEPAICLSICVPFAMREAVSSARKDVGIPATQWFNIDGPHTTEKLCLSAATRLEDFKFR
ncbi:hypothetical protein evm_007156 [Chilo suppressalis]|nr:hypothetical protein evm_007156 [Chilo suppressalis]